MLLKHKNIIKLQAAVRGHIERRHAVGSLRCVQAIAKMQVLVRQRRARLLVEESTNGKENQVSVGLVMNNSASFLISFLIFPDFCWFFVG